MRIFCVAFFFLLIYSELKAQQGTPDPLTENFVFSIQTIDDFFDRFNFEPSTPAFQYYKDNYPTLSLDRKTIIFSLFDLKNSTCKNEDINNFASDFESDSASKLCYNKPGWYSVLHCKVIYKKKRRIIDLIMQIDSIHMRKNSVGYKWSLRSVKAGFIHGLDSLDSNDTSHVTAPPKSKAFLQPMSHAIDFMNIDDIFRKKMTREYFAKQASSAELDTLVNMIDQGRLKFVQVDSISYHLLQLPGWIVEVKCINRQDNNSGWLISRLMPVDENEKINYLQRHLNIR